MSIVADTSQNLVLIDDFRLEGWLDQRTCPGCGAARIYYLVYDAYFCASCNAWLELRCDDPRCDVCACRPVRPLPDR